MAKYPDIRYTLDPTANSNTNLNMAIDVIKENAYLVGLGTRGVKLTIEEIINLYRENPEDWRKTLEHYITVLTDDE